MNKFKEKSNGSKVMCHILAGTASENRGITLFNGRLVLKYLSELLAKPLYALQSAQQSLENCLLKIYNAMQQNNMSRPIDPEKILKNLERFGPSEEIYETNCLKLYYTSGIEYMARECRAWNLIMAINANFETLKAKTAPIVIKIQGIKKKYTKVTYYSGSLNVNASDDEYITMTFPLKEIILFYIGGVFMLASEYRRTT